MADFNFNQIIDNHYKEISKVVNGLNNNHMLTPILGSTWAQHHYANAVADLVKAKASLKLAQLTYAREIADNL